MNFLFFRFECSLKDNFNSKPIEIYHNLNQLYVLSEKFYRMEVYVMTQNVNIVNLKISQRTSLVE